MPKILQSDTMRAGLSPVSASGANDTVPMLLEYQTKAGVALEAGDVIEMVELPVNHTIWSIRYANDQVDSGAAMTARIGFMAGDPHDTTFANRTASNVIGEQFLAAGAFGRAVEAVPIESVSAWTQEPSEVRRSIGIQIVAAPGTQVTGAKLRLLVEFRAK